MTPFEVRWQNVRSIADTDWLPVRPLTILLGANSSGKSSLLLPLLLLKQTLDARDSDVALNTRGSLINAGSYRDVIYEHDKTSRISCGFRFSDGEEPPPRQQITALRDETPLGKLPPVEGLMDFERGSYPGDVNLADYQLKLSCLVGTGDEVAELL